jgi:hypothetical protein
MGTRYIKVNARMDQYSAVSGPATRRSAGCGPVNHATGFAQATVAVNVAATFNPQSKVFPGHSTNGL